MRTHRHLLQAFGATKKLAPESAFGSRNVRAGAIKAIAIDKRRRLIESRATCVCILHRLISIVGCKNLQIIGLAVVFFINKSWCMCGLKHHPILRMHACLAVTMYSAQLL